MKFHVIASLLVSVFLATLASPLYAEDTDAPEAHSKFEHYYVDYKVNEDGTVESSFDWSITILQKDAVDYLKHTSITYSTSAEKADIVEAYTHKPDGKRIDAPKDNFQLEVDSGKDKNAPAFSDQTTLSVIFPDVAVGDTVHISYKIVQTEPMFPKSFSLIKTFSKSYPYDDARITISFPLSLKANYESFGLTEKTSKEENGRKIIEWTYQNKSPIKIKRSGARVYNPEKEPGFLMSNFPSYAAIATAYGERAKPKAVVTDKIQKLADEITKGKTVPRDQAQALYTWVIENIGYAGNCIGVGAVVPRDLDFVVGNKIGDCKDHATLLQALLAAKGIQSTQALIDAGPIYHLPKIPVVSIVNHVINYIPSLDLFLDSTSQMPFGLLPSQLAGKPVLLVDGFKEGLTTPTLTSDMGSNQTQTKITIHEDGSVDGTVHTTLHGAMAAEAYDALKKMHKDQEKELLDNMVKKTGYEGKLELKREEFNDTNFTYGYEFKFNLKNLLKVGSPGAFYVYPLFAQSLLGLTIAESHVQEIAGEFICSGGHMEEEYIYEFPKNVHILAIPDNVTVANKIQSYKSTYQQNGDTLKVTRTLDDATPGPTCTPEIDKAYKEIADKALPDLKAQIVYK